MIDDNQHHQPEKPETELSGDAPRRRSRRRGRRGKSRGVAGAIGEQQPAAEVEAPAAPAPQRPPSHREQRVPEHRQPVRSGFGDGLDREVCMLRMPGYPNAWPVNHRTGLAVQPLVEVGRTSEAVLLCDRSHEGPCIWPGYIAVEEDARSDKAIAQNPAEQNERAGSQPDEEASADPAEVSELASADI
jgi:hypothetical protein